MGGLQAPSSPPYTLLQATKREEGTTHQHLLFGVHGEAMVRVFPLAAVCAALFLLLCLFARSQPLGVMIVRSVGVCEKERKCQQACFRRPPKLSLGS